MNRVRNTVVGVALIFSIGLHWPVLQSVAWLNMIVSYTQAEGLEQAIMKTFDGKHPCNICHFVEAGQQAEKKEAKQLALKKLDYVSDTQPLILFGPDIVMPEPELCPPIRPMSHAPPTPPPNFS